MLTLLNMSLGAFLERRDTGRLSPATVSNELDRLIRAGKMTAEQADDQLERLTGCRFGNPTVCHNPDCYHNGYKHD